MQRHLTLRGFNNVVLRNNTYGGDVDPSNPVDYFEFRETSKSDLFDRILDLATKPIYTTGMGQDMYLHTITGLTFEQLWNNLDLKQIEKIEKSMDMLSEAFNSTVPQPKLPEE